MFVLVSKSSVSLTSSQDTERHLMPPLHQPRALHLPYTDENTNKNQQSTIPTLSQSRTRRLQQKTTPTICKTAKSPTPVITVFNEDEEKEPSAVNQSLINKIRENDTIARFRREASSPGHFNQKDDNNLNRASISARQRRRKQRFNSTTGPDEYDNNPPTTPPTPPVYDRFISNDSQIDAVEQERKAKRDINHFLHELDTTLCLPVTSTPTEIPSMFDRTMMTTNKLEERRGLLRENCLKEIAPKN